ncbi:hypothetical protein [Methylorubrum sp. SL192]|uniref:hypothetical protein n=1 Tax=Methylorubrum sp. SL192 TaxID=2995167 RepID=UPI0022735B86|nr:hypothetical protein [Methylorubrum sp. SL192]MCY1640675.1 hypothetical protein [Methylorubrum sp. SL192]
MSQLAAMYEAFSGLTCQVIRREFDWLLYFDEARAVVLTAPWRIVSEGRIAFADQDDGQKFGHPEPIAGEAKANGLIGGRVVTAITVEPISSDLTITFKGGVTLELFNGSAGYEAWQADFPSKYGNQVAIGLGGGGVSMVSR